MNFYGSTSNNHITTLIRLLNRAFRDSSLSVGIADIKLCLTGVSIMILNTESNEKSH